MDDGGNGRQTHGCTGLPQAAARHSAQVKRPLALVTPINIANWALGGFYLSLVPSLVASTTGSRAPLTGGAVVAALMAAGAFSVFLRRAHSPRANLTFGVSAATIGILTVVAGTHLANVPVLIIGTLITGMGFGTSFLGSVGSIMPLAKADERAALLSAFYVQSYLAFSLPAILAGILAKTLGYQMTTDIYAAAIIATGVTGLMASRARLERATTAARGELDSSKALGVCSRLHLQETYRAAWNAVIKDRAGQLAAEDASAIDVGAVSDRDGILVRSRMTVTEMLAPIRAGMVGWHARPQ